MELRVLSGLSLVQSLSVPWMCCWLSSEKYRLNDRIVLDFLRLLQQVMLPQLSIKLLAAFSSFDFAVSVAFGNTNIALVMRQVASRKSKSQFDRAARGPRRHSHPLSSVWYTLKVKPREIAIDALHSRGWLKAFPAHRLHSLIPLTKSLFPGVR